MEARVGIEPTHKGFVPRLALVEATTGFEPVNNGFADRRLGPLGYVAEAQSSLGMSSEVETQTLALPFGYRAIAVWLARDAKRVSRVETQTLALPFSANWLSGPALFCGGGYAAPQCEDTDQWVWHAEGARILKLAGRLKVDLPPDAQNIHAIRVIAVLVLSQRLDRTTGGRESCVILIIAARLFYPIFLFCRTI